MCLCIHNLIKFKSVFFLNLKLQQKFLPQKNHIVILHCFAFRDIILFYVVYNIHEFHWFNCIQNSTNTVLQAVVTSHSNMMQYTHCILDISHQRKQQVIVQILNFEFWTKNNQGAVQYKSYPKLILNPNLMKSHLPLTYISVTKFRHCCTLCNI